jgi:hypothetical protein
MTGNAILFSSEFDDVLDKAKSYILSKYHKQNSLCSVLRKIVHELMISSIKARQARDLRLKRHRMKAK